MQCSIDLVDVTKKCFSDARKTTSVSACDGAVIKHINEHTHDSLATSVEAAKIVTAIKNRAETTMEATFQIINESICAGNGISQSTQVL